MSNNKCIIEEITIYQCKLRLNEPFIISVETNLDAENIFVRIRTSNGITGFGECNPSPVILGESLETGFIVGQYLADKLLGHDALEIEACIDAMDHRITWNYSIKSAFDMALYDIASQNAGLPLYEYLGGRKDKIIAIDYTVSIGEPEKMALDALKIKQEGYPVIKVKLGEAARDIDRLRAIRASVGMDIPVRIDANQGWKAEEAPELLNALSQFNIEYCEAPIPRWDFMRLPEIRKNSPIPIMADESCIDHHDAERLIKLDACDYINLKTGKSGIFKTLKIIELAEKAGMKMQFGGMLETRLGFTASAHLALISDLICWYDFDSPLMMAEDPVLGGITYGKGGVVTVPDVPGLGASIDPAFLDKLTKVIIMSD